MNILTKLQLKPYNLQVKGNVNVNNLSIDWMSEKYSKFYVCGLKDIREKQSITVGDKEYEIGQARRSPIPINIYENKQKNLFDTITKLLSDGEYTRQGEIALINENFTIKACEIIAEVDFKYRIMRRNQYSKMLEPILATTYNEFGKAVKVEVTSTTIKTTVLEEDFDNALVILNKLEQAVEKWKITE